jgi:hypothetical protein
MLPLFGFALAACGSKGPNDLTHDDGLTPGDAAADGNTFTVDWFENWEDGDREIIPAGGRFGQWFNYDDQTEGKNSIAVVGLDPLAEVHTTFLTTSKMALRVQATGYNNWGSGYSADLAAAKPYDLSAYDGIVLWAKNLSPVAGSIRVSISDASSDPRGGVCDMSVGAPVDTACYDPFGQVIDLVGDWQMYRLPFWALQQGGWGRPEPTGLDTRHVYTITIADNAGVTYDYYLDDIGFYRERE